MNRKPVPHAAHAIGWFLVGLFLPGGVVAIARAQTTRPAVPPAVEPPPKATFTAAQIQQMLDQPVEPVTLHNALLVDVLRQLEGTRARWLDLPGVSLSFLPYGELTPVSLKVPPPRPGEKTTIRMLLNALLDPVALHYRIIEDSKGRAVLRIVPRPELARIGRRATIDEMELLTTIRHLRIESPRTPLAGQLSQALGRPVQFHFDMAGMTGPEATRRFNETVAELGPNTPAGLLDQFCVQGPWTWRVDENSIRLLDRSKQVVHQLRRHVSVRWVDLPLEEALVQVSLAGGLLAQFQPGLMEGLEEGSRRTTWETPDQAILQIVETVVARTGLAYEVREESIYFFSPRGGRAGIDPVIGMVSIPSRTGQFNYQFFIRKSMLPAEAQAVLEQQTKQAIDSIVKELGSGKPPAPGL